MPKFRFHLPPVQIFNRKSEVKEDWVNAWKDEISKGNARYEVTQTLGYLDAVAEFEREINQRIADKTLNLDEVSGIQRVFRYFEDGKLMADKASEQLNKFQNER